MARREHVLDTPINLDDALGNPVAYDRVRIIETVRHDPNRSLTARWQIGRVVGGQWEPAGSRHSGMAVYNDAGFATLIGTNVTDNGTPGTRTDEEIQDKIYDDLDAAGKCRPGINQDYDFDASSSSSGV
jgi:hypothetical protein